MDHNTQIPKVYNATQVNKEVNRLHLLIDRKGMLLLTGNKDLTSIQLIFDIHFDENSERLNLEDQILQVIRKHISDKNSLQFVNITLLESDFTLVPDAFYRRENAKEILEFSTGKSEKTVLADSFNGMKLLYAPSSELQYLLEKEFKNSIIKSSGIVAIELFFTNPSLKQKDVWINFHDGSIELLAKKGKKLIFYNLFTYENPEEVLYYLLFMAEQFDLDPEKFKLVISGNILVNSDHHTLIKKYIRNISFAVGSVHINEHSWNLPEHFYFTLLNQHLCG